MLYFCNMITSRLLTALACMAPIVVAAQTFSLVKHYDEENGVPSHHITQMLQDSHGFMWFSTWNGLCRFDGYDFQTFKPEAGDGCTMANDRIRNIALRPDGKIICQVEENEYYLFDTRTYRFCDIHSDSKNQASADMQRYRQSKSAKGEKAGETTFTLTDMQGNEWRLTTGSISLYRKAEQHAQPLSIQPAAEVKCLFSDRQGRIWLTTREDAAVRIYDADMQPIGYLGPDGNIHKSYTSFGAAIYCMCQSSDGTLWLGSKPHGLFRLTPAGSQYTISQPAAMSSEDIYNIKEDSFGRLWIATMRHGLYYTDDHHTKFLTPKHYPQERGQRIRLLHITSHGLLIAAATDGLFAAKIEKNADSMHFIHHQREANREESLSSSATMDIAETTGDQLLVSTESGGVNIVAASSLLTPQPHFRHLNAANHGLPSDIALSLAPLDENRVMVTSSRLVTILDRLEHIRTLDAHHFAHSLRFADARPLPIAHGRWLFGLKDGAFVTSAEEMLKPPYTSPIVLTNIEVRGEGWEVRRETSAESLDTLMLHPQERSVTIHFAALDYCAPERISYAFRLCTGDDGDSTQWNHIGHDRSATLLNLPPGTYCLEVRGERWEVRGEGAPRTRKLTIIVQPTFWEAWYGQLLILLMIVAAVAAVVSTLLYIRRIKRRQRETLEAYLALIEVKDNSHQRSSASEAPEVSLPPSVTSDPTLERIMKFVEENISNADIGVGDMAAAAAVSRSGLQRKLKQTMGITPLDLLREARIKHACQLLQHSDNTVAETAFACGFTDPKYFSRCFKQTTGMSHTEYKMKQ